MRIQLNNKPGCAVFSPLRMLPWLTAFAVIAFSLPLQAQQTSCIIKANRAWCGMYENGGVGQFNYYSGFFPTDYNCMGPSMESGQAHTGSNITTATTNWSDPNGTVIPKAVVRPVDVYSKWTVQNPLVNSIRYGYPTNIINAENKTMEDWGEVNPGKMIGTSDQTATVTTRNAMGIDIQRTVFAFAQRFHDNYIVCDLVLTNRSGQTLNDFWVSFHEAPFYWRKANGAGDPDIPEQDQVDRNAAWHHYYGAREGDSLRIFYMYSADYPQRTGDQMGAPVASQDGRLIDSDFMFYTILHASKQPYTNPADDVDDHLQPRSTTVYAEVPMAVQGLWGGADASGRDLIYDLIAGKQGKDQPMEGQISGTFHRANNDEQGDPDYTNLGEGFSASSIWNRSISSFGPYTFGDGESIHIVYASGYCGLGVEKAKEIGEKWLNRNLADAPNLPDARTGYFPSNFAFPSDATEQDIIKDRWISTVIDSVHKSASRAKWNFEHNWQVPGAPPPPNQEVTGYGDGVEIKWSCPGAEALSNFAGYRIMRRLGRQDTSFFKVVHQTPASEKATEHVWTDTDIRVGASYYYYVQSGIRIDANDPNAHPDSRGKIFWSGRLWNPTRTEVVPPRKVGEKLSDIRIVPNPYNIKDPLLLSYGLDEHNRKLWFYNLPAEVTIKIFTESGDLVKTIVHNPPNRVGSIDWDLLTDNQQAIASGVYIARFEKPDGETAIQKFLVVR